MRKILLLIGLLIGTFASGQIKQTTNQYGFIWKRGQTDSAAKMPMVIVGIKDGNAGLDTAQYRYDKADSSVKIWTGSQWLKIGTGAGGSGIGAVYSDYGLLNVNDSTLKVDSATLANYFLRRKDSTVYYPYASNPLGYISGNQSITLSGDVSGSGTTAITTTIGNNKVTGAMIAMGSDAAGDILYYNGTDYIRLPAGTANQILHGGTTPAWRDTTAVTSTNIYNSNGSLTGNRTVTMGANNLTFSSASGNSFTATSSSGTTLGHLTVNVSNSYLLGQAADGYETQISSQPFTALIYSKQNDRESRIDFRPDSIKLSPGLGQLNIDSLRTGSGSDSVLVWNKTTGVVGYRDASAFGGSGTTDLTFTGSGPYTLNSSTGTDVTFTQGDNIIITRSSNDLSFAADTTTGGTKLATQGDIVRALSATTLASLSDVNVGTPSGGEILEFQSGDNKWHAVNFVKENISNTSLTANGNYTQNWDSFQLKIKNIKELELRSDSSGTGYSTISMGDPSGNNSTDLYSQSNSTLYSNVTTYINKIPEYPAVQINAHNGSDNARITTLAATSSTSVLIEAYNPTKYSAIEVNEDSVLLYAEGGKLAFQNLNTDNTATIVYGKDASGRVVERTVASIGGGSSYTLQGDSLSLGWALYSPSNITHGSLYCQYYWPPLYPLTRMWYEYWYRPFLGSEYMISAGYGGAHSLLIGNSGQHISGNVWDGTNTITFTGITDMEYGDDVHVAVSLDGTDVGVDSINGTIVVYLNGVPDGEVAYLGNRNLPVNNGTEDFYVFGSDHSRADAYLYHLRGFEYFLPYDHKKVFTPEKIFGNRPAPAILLNTTIPQAVVQDKGIFLGVKHDGLLQPVNGPDSLKPQWVRAKITKNDYAGSAPSIPGGAKIYDSFKRTNKTPAFESVIMLDSTEGGTAGRKPWIGGDSTTFYAGIIYSTAYFRDPNGNQDPQVGDMKVDVGSSDQDITVTSKSGAIVQSLKVIGRFTDGNNAVYLNVYSTASNDCVLRKWVAGVPTTLATFSAGATHFTDVRMVISGSTVDVWVDGVQKVTAASITDVPLGTYAGMGDPLGSFTRVTEFQVD